MTQGPSPKRLSLIQRELGVLPRAVRQQDLDGHAIILLATPTFTLLLLELLRPAADARNLRF